MKALVAHSQAPLEREPGEIRLFTDAVRRLRKNAEFVRCPSFEQLHKLTPELTSSQRRNLFDRLGPTTTRALYDRERDRLEALRIAEGEVEWPEERADVVPNPGQRTRRPRNIDVDNFGDVLRDISPRDYVEPLTGKPVDRFGNFLCPSHDDTHPSAVAYEAPERGWYCFTCGAGGSIIDLAAALTGIEPRGRGYHALREWIAERLLGVAA